MKTLFKHFTRDEDGAVTVDWVVLTAGIVGLGIAVAVSVGQGATATGSSVGDALDAMSIATY